MAPCHLAKQKIQIHTPTGLNKRQAEQEALLTASGKMFKNLQKTPRMSPVKKGIFEDSNSALPFAASCMAD